MKRYIRATTEDHTIFDEKSTHVSYYDNFLDEKDLEYMRKSKNRDGKIVMMTPDDYYEEASKIFKISSNNNTDVASLVKQRSTKTIDKYVQDMKNGDQFPLPYLNYADGSQEGLHRMLAAKRAFGPDVKYPVLVVTAYDQKREDAWKLRKEILDFERYDLDRILDDLASHLSWNFSKPPKNICEISKEFVESEAKAKGHDIQVDCEVNAYDGEKRLDVYLTEYNGHEIEDPEQAYNSPWFDNMFKPSRSDEDIDDYLEGLSDDEFEALLKEDPELYGLLGD